MLRVVVFVLMFMLAWQLVMAFPSYGQYGHKVAEYTGTCKTKADLDRIIQATLAQDWGTVRYLIKTGRCSQFQRGSPVQGGGYKARVTRFHIRPFP